MLILPVIFVTNINHRYFYIMFPLFLYTHHYFKIMVVIRPVIRFCNIIYS